MHTGFGFGVRHGAQAYRGFVQAAMQSFGCTVRANAVSFSPVQGGTGSFREGTVGASRMDV